MFVRRAALWLTWLAAALALAACADMHEPKLYDRLGGRPAIQAVVDEFVANIAADNRINQRFARTDIPKLKMHLVDQVCEASGGPCKYTGRDMPTTHKGMNVTVAEFNATGEAMLKALRRYNVPQRKTDEVMDLLGSMQNQIVGK
ncbi:MAG: group 1 truncated hemoglobin [Alphaproteobacteria bacterium]|nr:group 1 truncated hemoglobin [Alphaproteobacteria bacterium]